MLYPDYKMRYACLGQAEIASSSDNKTATYALMDKIGFDRERYRLGHTLVFFRAGALAKPEEALRQLEEKANATYGEYKAALDKTAELEASLGGLKDEIGAMTKQLAEEQGSISVYTDRQAKANQIKAEAEVELSGRTKVLKEEEESRVALAAEVKAHSGSIGAVKKDIEDVELAITKVETEKGNRDHTIKTLQDEIAEQDEVINKLNKEKKHLSATQAKSAEDLESAEEKVKHP